MKPAGIEADLHEFATDLGKVLAEMEGADFAPRLHKKDPTLWKTEPEHCKIISNAMGWLDSPEKIKPEAAKLCEFGSELQAAGFRHVLHMGMGGSSLAPLVFSKTLGESSGGLPVTVLDSTDPATVLRFAGGLPLAETFFIEASKSGTTAESRSFGEYFFEKVQRVKASQACANFAVITDPGSMLAGLAGERTYRRTFLNYPDIGGRYSALSYFGLVPAALMQADLPEVLARTEAMIAACRIAKPLSDNPGVCLGAAMGALARRGRNKLTFLIPQPLASLGMWLEQLIAESTGKDGKGIVPVAGEPAGPPEAYGNDRLFVVFVLENKPDPAIESCREALVRAGQPVITIRMSDRLDLGRQFFLWEVATATAGAVLEINPFDQPDVQETKKFTGKILEDVRQQGRVPEAEMKLVEGPLRLYLAGGASTVRQAVSMFFEQAGAGDYFATLAYLTENEATGRGLQNVRTLVRDRLRLATTVGYGPRYLHSTGQLHKGGPNSGLFLLLTSDFGDDAPIPGQPYTFGMLMRAQALGDFEALRKHRRRVLRVHVAGQDVAKGLSLLEEIIREAVPQR